MNKKQWFLPALCMLLLPLTGCWDRVEIDQRGFVTGVAIDKGEYAKEAEKRDDATGKILGTYQIIIPAGLKQASGGKDGSASSSGKATFNISATENTMPALSAKLSAMTSRTPYFEHLKIIVISSEVLKNSAEFASLVDYFLRDNEMRRVVKILITDGRAKDVLNVNPLNEKYSIAYIESTIKNAEKSSFILPETRIGDLHEMLLREHSFTVQKISTYKQGISLAGAAVFDESNRFIGFLSGEETQGLNLMRGQVKGGMIQTEMEHQPIDFEIERGKRKIQVDFQSDRKLKFTITINLEGSLAKSMNGLDLEKLDTLHKMENQLQAEIGQICQKTIQTLQNKYQKDAIGLGEFLYENHYSAWKALKKDWEKGENLFSTTEIEVKAKVKIRRLGDINRSE